MNGAELASYACLYNSVFLNPASAVYTPCALAQHARLPLAHATDRPKHL